MKKHEYFTIQGKPFFSIGGQVHNSSGYAIGAENGEAYERDAERSFESLRALGANTAAIPVCWDAFEPEEGKFNFGYVKRIIDRCREHNLHAILLWFGSWKNGQMEYTPVWVKKDRKRFVRARLADGQETTALSPFYDANREQDKKAFCRLMECIREYDGQTGTVLAVQVENEPGMYAASIRDFSEKGTEAFQGMVPAAVIDAVRGDAGEAGDAWRENGRKENGSWAEVFGRFGAELCMAWATAEYINDIALAGKQIYDIFMYVNVWMDRNSEHGWSIAGLDYPSGGAVSKVLPVWLAACTGLDAVCPDIYEQEPDCIRRTQELYDWEGRPFYVPESGLTNVNASMMFEAVGNHRAIGYHVFGTESCLDENGKLKEGAEGIMHSFAMLRQAKPLLENCMAGGKVFPLVQNVGQDAFRLKFGEWLCRVSYAGAAAEYAGWVAMDCRHGKDLAGINRVPMSLEEETARGLLFQTREKEFYLVGHKVRLYWQKMDRTDGSISPNMLNIQHQAHNMELLCLEEGHFEGGEFVTDRVRSGDEARHGIWAQYDCGVVHFILGD